MCVWGIQAVGWSKRPRHGTQYLITVSYYTRASTHTRYKMHICPVLSYPRCTASCKDHDILRNITVKYCNVVNCIPFYCLVPGCTAYYRIFRRSLSPSDRLGLKTALLQYRIASCRVAFLRPKPSRSPHWCETFCAILQCHISLRCVALRCVALHCIFFSPRSPAGRSARATVLHYSVILRCNITL